MNNYKCSKLAIALSLSTTLFAVNTAAQELEKNDSGSEENAVEELTILGSSDDRRALSGSAHAIGETELESFEYVDLGQVLSSVPGVYIRQEDGFGLRPNIAIRAVTGDRSQKINLMEDGILITPAPYSAPAAYYVPNVNRMSSVEVFKGPSAILYGPNTVGGAINLVTPSVPKSGGEGELDLAYGSFSLRKARVSYGQGTDAAGDVFGFYLEGFYIASDGFKELDNGEDTGFEKIDFNTRFLFDLTDNQQLIMKLGYAVEESDETYLGLTDTDFDDDPMRRYIGSAEDKFVSDHAQVHLIHLWDASDTLSLKTSAYVNTFYRSWNKLDAVGAYGGTQLEISDVLKYGDSTNVGVYTRALGLLKGDINSGVGSQDVLDVTDNERWFVSQGLELRGNWVETFGSGAGAIDNELSFGVRLHQDTVKREHQAKGYTVSNGRLINNGISYALKTDNEALTNATSLFVNNALSIAQWTISTGVRIESYSSTFDDFKADTSQDRDESIVLPGIGVVYQPTENWSLIVGVNKGFSPNGPAAAKDAKPEESINYEYGFRFAKDGLEAEVIGFYSDYSNLLGRCGVSDAGCDDGDEFNAGDVAVVGVESSVNYEAQLKAVNVPVQVSYTYSDSAFQSGFSSNFGQWGSVEKGDELPYLPNHQLRFMTGVSQTDWELLFTAKYIGEMRDKPGQADVKDEYKANGEQYTKALTTMDVSFSYFIDDAWATQLVLENVTNEIEAVSYKPFGARPNKPFAATASVKYRF